VAAVAPALFALLCVAEPLRGVTIVAGDDAVPAEAEVATL
jgi:hypothetical protein